MFVRSGSPAHGRTERTSTASRLRRLLLASTFCALSISTAESQVTPQQHIRIKKETKHTDTVWIHDTVTMARVDTVWLGLASQPSVSAFRVDTLIRMDTTKDCRDFFLPVPIPIPITHGHDNPGANPVTVNPEPTTIVMVGIGLATIGIVARRRRKSKEDPT